MNDEAAAVSGPPRMILKLEGFALFVISLYAYAKLGYSWWLFGALIFAPDVGMLGYLKNPRLGAQLYNVFHITALPIGIGAWGYAWSEPLALAIALVWLAHIGMDRMLGYGLKYETGFTDTHLGKIGKES